MSHRYSKDPDAIGRDLSGLREYLRALATAEDSFLPLQVGTARHTYGEHLCQLALRCGYAEERKRSFMSDQYLLTNKGKRYLAHFGWEE